MKINRKYRVLSMERIRYGKKEAWKEIVIERINTSILKWYIEKGE